MPTVALKPGPELDAAVAQARGWPPEIATQRHPFWMSPEAPKCAAPFQPSTDLNAAFAAAEKCGLFDRDRILSRNREIGATWWCVYDTDSSDASGGWHKVGYAETPALAICAAILSLHGEK